MAFISGATAARISHDTFTCLKVISGILRAMEKQERPEPISPRCLRCGEQPKFISSMLDPPTGRTFHMFECQCGSRTWISEKMPK
jgi:hypothetical protein